VLAVAVKLNVVFIILGAAALAVAIWGGERLKR
jgi:hypothetical protein